MKYNLLNDVANLTRTKTSILSKFTDIGEACICDYLNELQFSDEDIIDIDISIGTLRILVLDSEVKYQFRPNAKLEKAISKTILDSYNPLVKNVENNLEKRLLYTYKELI